MNAYSEVHECRICGNSRLEPVLDLGNQMLTGVFPRDRSMEVTVGPLQLVKCEGDARKVCGLLQLAHTYDLNEMYGQNYGYRSGLNSSMVAHLRRKVSRIENMAQLDTGDLVIDVGSNDGTTLSAYKTPGIQAVGIDPTASKFRQYYPKHVTLIPDFFTAELIHSAFPGRTAKVVTSFSMFYDLESPMDFMRQVHEILSDDGIWVFEQSYMPSMLRTNSYDTVCHEHLEFYSLHQIKWMADRVGFSIRDVEFNDVNGGSFSVTVSKARSGDAASSAVEAIFQEEREAGLACLQPYRDFERRVRASRDELSQFLGEVRDAGRSIAGIGASTKGNVLLQYCDISPETIPVIGEVNPEKFGTLTPGTFIPIVPEAEVLAQRPDFLLILPWHFRTFFESAPAFKGMNLVFPLPSLSVAHL